MRGVRLKGRDLAEIIDLYLWGARMSDICMLYDVERQTIRSHLRACGVKMRAPYKPAYVEPKRPDDTIKSTRPRIPAGARLVDGDQAPDQLLHSSARAQQDMRIAARLAGANTRSCQEAAS